MDVDDDGRGWVAAYLAAHSLSVPSRRYSFLLWIAVVLVFLAFAVLHWTGSRGGLLGAVWSKWALRRRTWRKKHAMALARTLGQPHRQPISLPSNAQLLSLSVLTLASLALAFVGPDYLDPNLRVWHIQSLAAAVPDAPQHTISKSLWSSSARTGQITFALLPLCVLFALKAPPFAIFAVPFMIQIYFDKLAWLHRWAGRLIWLLVSIHVVLWSVQLAIDVNPSTGRVAYVYAWSYTPFVYGWIAFALLTLIILLSLHPVRRRFYEHFYVLHVLLVPCMLVVAGLHHPSVAWWCWTALVIWIGERVWRATWWIYANGIVGRVALGPSRASADSSWDAWEMHHVRHSSFESSSSPRPTDAYSPPTDNSPISVDHDRDAKVRLFPHPAPSRTPFSHSSTGYVPPHGYVHAELLSGGTVRLRLVTPGFLPWSPGQHFLLNIPSVSWFTSHPFTCASVCDEEAPTDAGRIMLFLVRAKSGWTQDLWNLVSRLTAERSRRDVSPTFASDGLPKTGVLLRAFVDGPFGSAKRARWGNYSTGVIITGGSGVSFGLSLLQYMCMCVSGRDGRYLGGRPGGWGWKGAELKRVRFIWLVREYSHVQWCASIIRHCLSIVPSSALQIDIYVTNFKPIPIRYAPQAPQRPHFNRECVGSDDELQPPHPNFARENSGHFRSRSTESVDSHESFESDVDLSYYLGENLDDEPPAVDDLRIAHETHILDLTNFDGDVDMALPGEAYLSRRLKKEGKLRRQQSRKISGADRTNHDGALLLSPPVAYGEVRTSRHQNAHDYSRQADQNSTSLRPSRAAKTLTLSTHSTDRLLPLSPLSPLSERPHSASSEVDLYSASSHRSESPLHPYPPLSPDSPTTVSHVPMYGSSRIPAYPTKAYHDTTPEHGKSHAIQVRPPSGTTTNTYVHGPRSLPTSPTAPQPPPSLEMDEQEARDVNVVSEHARTGKPRLDKVIADEVEASKGAIVVACCGPTSLNAMVRKIVAARIDPGRIRRGDMRGLVTLVSEEFEY